MDDEASATAVERAEKTIRVAARTRFEVMKIPLDIDL